MTQFSPGKFHVLAVSILGLPCVILKHHCDTLRDGRGERRLNYNENLVHPHLSQVQPPLGSVPLEIPQDDFPKMFTTSWLHDIDPSLDQQEVCAQIPH